MVNLKTAVIGAGPWGTAFACLLKEKGHDVKLWAFRKILDKEILPSEGIFVSAEVTECVKDADYIFIVLNSQFFISTLDVLDFSKIKYKKFILLTKGLVKYGEEYLLPFQVLIKRYDVSKNNIAALSGPNIASEIYAKNPAGTVVASENPALAKEVQKLLSSDVFRVYTSDDIIGLQWSGILKNPVAIAVGTCDYLYKDKANNTKSMLISRALLEMQRIAKHFGAKDKTFFGLAGVGDLITTCFAGRNRNVGTMIAEGKTLQQIYELYKPQVPEGVEQLKIIHDLIRGKIDAPIFEELYEVVFEKKDPEESVASLMSRGLKDESD